MCEWGFGRCTAPNTDCPHWIGCVCELDVAFYNFENITVTKAVTAERGIDSGK